MKRILSLLFLFILLLQGCKEQPVTNPNEQGQPEQNSVSEESRKLTSYLALIEEAVKDSGLSVSEATVQHQAEYDELISMDTKILYPAFELFEAAQLSETAGSALQSLCMNILGGEYIAIDTDTAQQWYSAYKYHVIYLANLNSVEYIKEHAPKSYTLLDVTSYEKKIYKTSEYLGNSEVMVSNGIRLSMMYDEAIACIGDSYELTKDTAKEKVVAKDGAEYVFRPASSSSAADIESFCLYEIHLDGGKNCALSGPRELNIGDSIEEVFSKFPVKSTQLKKWAEQALYGKQSAGNARATLYYITSKAAYRIYITTATQSLTLDFNTANQVKTISLVWENA